MDIGNQIIREIQIFGNAATGVYSMHNTGGRDYQPTSDLPTNLFEDPVPISGVATAESAESNDKMKRCLVNEFAGKMVISVWEILKDTEYVDKQYPEVMFLRHVRNGIAHDNRFQLSPGRLERHGPAEWDGHKLESSMDGTTVMTTIEAGGQFIESSNIDEGYLEAGDCKEFCSDLLRIVKE
jgi:hypothetical protein